MFKKIMITLLLLTTFSIFLQGIVIAQTCDELGGVICAPEDVCSGGDFQTADDTGYCCVGGVCEPSTPSCTNAGDGCCLPDSDGVCDPDCTTEDPDCATGCSSTNVYECYTETDCLNAGGYWCYDACSDQPCETTTQTCSEVGGVICEPPNTCMGGWIDSQVSDTDYCCRDGTCESGEEPTEEPTSNACSFENYYNCYTETECVSVGAYWCDGVCSNAPCETPGTCSSSEPWFCMSEPDCTSVGGYWCYDACSDQPCETTTTCSYDNFYNCHTEEECTNVGRYWCANTNACVYDEASCGGAGYCGDGFCDESMGEKNYCPQDCGGLSNERGMCWDGVDNDNDGMIDCSDPDCANEPSCGAEAWCDGSEWSCCEDSDCPDTCRGNMAMKGGHCYAKGQPCSYDVQEYCDYGCDNGKCSEGGSICGDSKCDPGEYGTCPIDCPVTGYCGDGSCDKYAGENEYNCPMDCKVKHGYCGDGVCDRYEDADMCPQDCRGSGEGEEVKVSVQLTPHKVYYNTHALLSIRTSKPSYCDVQITQPSGNMIFVDSPPQCSGDHDFFMKDLVDRGWVYDEGKYSVQVTAYPKDGVSKIGSGSAEFYYYSASSTNLVVDFSCNKMSSGCSYRVGEDIELTVLVKDEQGNPISGAFVHAFIKGEGEGEEKNCKRLPNGEEICVASYRAREHGGMQIFFYEERPGVYKAYQYVEPGTQPGEYELIAKVEKDNMRARKQLKIRIEESEDEYALLLDVPDKVVYQDSELFVYGRVVNPYDQTPVFPDYVTAKLEFVETGETRELPVMQRGPEFEIREYIPFNTPVGDVKLTVTASVQGKTITQTRDLLIKKLMRFYGRAWTDKPDYAVDEEITLYVELINDDGEKVKGAKVVAFIHGKPVMRREDRVASIYERAVGGREYYEEDYYDYGPGYRGPTGYQIRVEPNYGLGYGEPSRGPFGQPGPRGPPPRPGPEPGFEGGYYPPEPGHGYQPPQGFGAPSMPEPAMERIEVARAEFNEFQGKSKPMYWDEDKELYVTTFRAEKPGDYDVNIKAEKDEWREDMHTNFFVYEEGEADKISEEFGGELTEVRAVRAANNGDYDECAKLFLDAARKWSGASSKPKVSLFGRRDEPEIQGPVDAQRVMLNLEKAFMCNALGSNSRDVYSEAGEILANSNTPPGPEELIMKGLAGLYFSLAGEEGKGADMLRKAAIRIETGLSEGMIQEGESIFAEMMLARFYQLGGRLDKATQILESICKRLPDYAVGEDEASVKLLAYRFCEQAGKIEEANALLKDVLESLPDTSTYTGPESVMYDYLKGVMYERIGEKDQATTSFENAIPYLYRSVQQANVYDESDLPIPIPKRTLLALMLSRAYSFVGKTQESLSTKQNALTYLETRPVSENNLYIAMLAYSLGQDKKAKKFCEKTFVDGLSYGRHQYTTLLSITPICYEILGDKRKAEMQCAMLEMIPDPEFIKQGIFLGILPYPLSYCNDRNAGIVAEINVDYIESTCGNGVRETGETAWNCCVDAGCPSEDFTCSQKLNKCVRKENEIDPLEILNAVIKIENIKTKIEELGAKAAAIAATSTGEKKLAWENMASVIKETSTKLDELKAKFKELAETDKLTFDDLEEARGVFAEIKDALDEAVREVIKVM